MTLLLCWTNGQTQGFSRGEYFACLWYSQATQIHSENNAFHSALRRREREQFIQRKSYGKCWPFEEKLKRYVYIKYMKKILLLSAILIGAATASQAGVRLHLGLPLPPLPPLPHISIGVPAPVVVPAPVYPPSVYVPGPSISLGFGDCYDYGYYGYPRYDYPRYAYRYPYYHHGYRYPYYRHDYRGHDYRGHYGRRW